MNNSPNEKELWDRLERQVERQAVAKTPDLTIDLPFDQKLTVGSLKPNTVVEIATWRGTGGPDENSIRMLIGAGQQEIVNPIGALAEDIPEKKHLPLELDEVHSTPHNQVVPEPLASAPSYPAEENPSNTTFTPVSMPPHVSPDIPKVSLSEWGRGFVYSSTFYNKRARNLVHSVNKPVVDPRELLGRKNARKMNRIPRSIPGWLMAGLSVLSIALVIGGLNVSRILAFDHPQVGPDLPFGNANTALMAIQPMSEPVLGGLAMAEIDSKRQLVRVESIKEDSLTVATMSGSLEISREALSGPIAFVIPILGYLWLPFSQ